MSEQNAGDHVTAGSTPVRRTLLDVRGHALDVAAAHYREFKPFPDGDERRLRALVTADAVAYERYLLTGEAYTRPASPERGPLHQRVTGGEGTA